MIFAVLFILVALVALGILIRIATGRKIVLSRTLVVNVEIRQVDVNAFRNLVDPEEEGYLRASLPSATFRSVQRERLRAAIEYVHCVAHNAAILMRVGENARRSPNPSVAEAGGRLINSALHLRLYAFQALVKLHIGIVFPGQKIPAIGITDDYERTARLGVLLTCIKQPTSTTSTALTV